MRDETAEEVFILHNSLEEKAATILGRILFEFSRLEMELGLCAVWVESGVHLEQLTNKHEDSNFNKRLEFMRESIDRLLSKGSESHAAYTAWCEQADEARKLRNDLIHGRWGVEAVRDRVVNVIGLPTSPNQRSVSYSLEQLQQVVESLRALRKSLSEIRQRWPL